MNANLMGAPCLEAAFHKREVSKAFLHANVGYCPLALARLAGAAAPAIASITNNPRFNPLVFSLPAHNGKICALDGVRAELAAQVALRINGPREDDEAARVPVEPMDGAHGRGTALLFLCNRSGKKVCQRRREKPPRSRAEFRRFLRVPHRCQSRRFLNNNHGIIDIPNCGLRNRSEKFRSLL
jgi:hypothetical protein